MAVGERLRRLLGAVDSDEDEALQQEPVITSHDALADGNTDAKSVPPLTDREDAALPIAQGQELLGPCESCAGYWTREIVRGQKPRTCPVCKREGSSS